MMTRVHLAPICGILLLAGTVLSAPQTKYSLGASQRVPLPGTVEVLRLARSEKRIWFTGVDHSAMPPASVVFAWSADGLTRVAAPSGSITEIVTDGTGDALLLAGGKVWASRGSVFALLKTEPGTIRGIAGRYGFWLLTHSNEIFHLPAVDAPLQKTVAVEERVTAFAAGPQGELMYATEGGQVWSMRPHEHPRELVFENDSEVRAIIADFNGAVWIATVDGRFAKHLAGTTDWFDTAELPVNNIVEDSEGRLAFVVPQSDTERAWLRARVMLGDPSGLVHDLYIEDPADVWIAAGRRGAFRVQGTEEVSWPADHDKTPALWTPVASAISEPKASQQLTGFSPMPGARLTFLNTARRMPNNYVSCGVSDGTSMYFGTGYQNIGPENESGSGAGIIRWDHRQFTSFNSGLPSQTVQACSHDPGTGALWFGTPSGVARLLNGSFTTFLPGTGVLDIAVRGTDVWVAALTGGVYRLSSASGAQTAQYPVASARVTSLAFDNAGTLWAGTSNGLFRFNGSNFVAESTGNILPSHYVMDVEADASGNLWISVWNHSVFRRTPGGNVTQFSIGPVFNGLRRVYAIRRDTANNLWFAHGNFGALNGPPTAFTFLAAAEVNATSPGFQGYSQSANGLPANQVLSLIPDADAMWLGTPGGGVWRIGGPFTAPGFPAVLQSFPAWTSPLLVDLDHDRDLEIVAGDDSGRIYAFRPDGSSLWTYDTRTSLRVPGGGSPGPISIHSSPAAGDVDGDGEIEIVVGLGGLQNSASYGGVLILGRNGEFKRLLTTFDSHTPDGLPEHVFATPALANVDADPELEIMVGSFDHYLYAWNGDGTPVYQRDDDGDGRYDEDDLGDITPNTPFDSSDDATGIKGVDDDGDGAVDEGPIASDDDEDGLIDEDYWEWPRNAHDTVWASAVVADLNADGQQEIVFGHDYSNGENQEFSRGGVIRVFTPRGTPVAAFPRGNLEQVIWSSPVAVDLDNDGQYEVMHGTGFEMQSVGDTPAEQLIGRLVYAWRSNGQPFRSCGANTAPGCFATTEGRSFASFAVGDLDNDGFPELVIATLPLRNKLNQAISGSGNVVPENQATGQQLYVFRSDGSVQPGFPVRPSPADPGLPLLGSPILADINNDGFLEIILNVRFGLMVFDRSGRVLPGMGLWENLQEDHLGMDANTTPAIADIDLDGALELVWLTPTDGGAKGAVQVVKLGATNSTYGRSWPQWRRGMNRNAIFGPLISITQAWESSGSLVLRAQALTGRAAAGSVTVNLTAIGGPAAQPMTAGPNAFYEHTLGAASVPPGRYHLPVTVTDTAGRTDTQTIIFVRRGGAQNLALSTATLSFGTVRQGETGMAQVTAVNTGSEPVTISGISSSSGEFLVAYPKTFPQILQPGQALSVTARFRPGPAAGTRIATLTIQSNAPARIISVTGSTPGGASGCNVTLTNMTTGTVPGGAIHSPGQAGIARLQTSPAGCAWTASSDVPWLQIFPGHGNGNIDLSYTVFPNLSLRPRSGRVLANGTVLVINQGQSVLPEKERFVAALYFGAFGRYPSAAEIQFHLSTLGTDPAAKAADLFTSAEFNLNGRFIAGLYLGVLGRLPEFGGWQFQRNAVARARGGAQQALARNFLESQEFLLRHPNLSNEEFVRFLYESIFRRPPNSQELAFHLSTLGAGDINARGQKATEFLAVPEYTSRTGSDLLARLLYFAFLQRNPTPEEFESMRARIPAGATKEQLKPIIRELLASSEYRAILI